MDPKIVMGIVTRQRPAQLRTCITSALATCGVPLQFVVGFDDDYWGYQQCLTLDVVHPHLMMPRHYYVRGKNAVYAGARDLAEGNAEYFVLSNDDSEWLAPNWGHRAVSLLEKSFEGGQGVLELFANGHLAHFISRFDFLDEFTGGMIADPMYTMYFSDSHLRNLLVEQEKYKAIHIKGSKLEEYHNRVVTHQLSITSDHLAFEVQCAWWEIDERVYNSIWTDKGKRVKDTAEDLPDDNGTTVPAS
jgi:hypothetical protein